MSAMNVHHVAGDAPFTSAVAFIGVGLCALFAAFWLAAVATGTPVFRRLLWRTMAVAAGLWVVCEVVGGHAFLARCIDMRPSRSAPGRTVATAVPPEPGGGEVTEPLVLETDWLQPPDAVLWEAAAAEYELVIEPTVAEPLAASGAASGGRESFSPQPRDGALQSLAKETPNLVLGWTAGSAVLALWFVARWVLVLWFAWRHTQPAGADVVAEVRAVVRRLESSVATGRPYPEAGTRRPDISGAGSRADLLRRFRVVESGSLAAPVVYGVVRPTLALPASFLQSLPRAQREAVLAHELVHVAARDPLWQVVFDAFAALAWWHPGAWLARIGHKTACEAAADDGAAALPGGSRALAAALVRLAREVAGQPRFGWAAVDRPGRRRSRLGRRVVRLLSRETVSRPLAVSRRAVAVRAAAVGVLILSLLFGTAVARSGDSNSAMQYGDDPMKVWQTTWRSSLAAAALAAMVGTSSAVGEDETAVTEDVEVTTDVELAVEEEEEVDELELAVEEEEEVDDLERREGGEDDVEERSAEADLEDELQSHAGLAKRAAEAALRRAQIVKTRLAEQQALHREQLALAEAQLRRAKEQLAHEERMADKGYIERAQLEGARSALESAKQALQARQRLAEALAAQEAVTELHKQRDKLLQDVRGEIDAKEKSSTADSGVNRRELAEAWMRAQREIERSLGHTKEQLSTEPEEMSKHVLQLLEKARAEAAEGRQESAQAIMEHVRQLARMRPVERPADAVELHFESHLMTDGEQRVYHLIQAAEVLKAAGNDDLAQQLLREAKKIAPKARFFPKPQVSVELQAKPEGPAAPEVDNLRREMNELKSQIDEMRSMLQRVVEQREGDREPERDE